MAICVELKLLDDVANHLLGTCLTTYLPSHPLLNLFCSLLVYRSLITKKLFFDSNICDNSDKTLWLNIIQGLYLIVGFFNWHEPVVHKKHTLSFVYHYVIGDGMPFWSYTPFVWVLHSWAENNCGFTFQSEMLEIVRSKYL